MRDISFFQPPPVYLDLGSQSLWLSFAGGVAEFPLERGADGKLTPGCRERVAADLIKTVGRKNWQLKPAPFAH